MTSIWVRWMNLDTQWNTRWNTTRFSSEWPPGFHLKWNMFFIWDQTFLMFHLRRHVKNSGFVRHHGFQTPRNRWKHSACGLVLSSVSWCLEPVMKHSPSFLTYYIIFHRNLRLLQAMELWITTCTLLTAIFKSGNGECENVERGTGNL